MPSLGGSGKWPGVFPAAILLPLPWGADISVFHVKHSARWTGIAQTPRLPRGREVPAPFKYGEACALTLLSVLP